MEFWKLVFGSKNHKTPTYTSQEMIHIANSWTDRFMKSAPLLVRATYNKDEIYMFCCWVILDYGKNYGYLDRNSKRDDFFSTIFQAVRNTGEYDQTDMEQFLFRVQQYKSEIMGMLRCDYPRTKMFFPETLFARFVNIDLDKFHSDDENFKNLCDFSDYLGSFWNKINRDIMGRYPKR
jgi:hypothetical protein